MIDWKFIASLEGADVLVGYVPDPDHSNSGVTVASGVDLSVMGDAEMASLSHDLQAKLRPYRPHRGADAAAYLRAHPLTLTVQEVSEINHEIQSKMTANLRARYGTDFDEIPDAAQTVIASVTYQYGTPWARCAIFWGTAIRKDWQGMIQCLDNFGDRYSTRREREADYLISAGLGH